jgi:AcrR family transcriptional regulator
MYTRRNAAQPARPGTPMAKKAPRRTAERILEVTLELFNRFGEPNVSTTLISAELNISPGNLYYHYPAKDELINSLFDRYERALSELLNASDGVRDVEDAWFFMHTLFELIWQYRFLYRDLNDLLSKNRRLETHFQWVLKNKTRSVRAMLGRHEPQRRGAASIPRDRATATSMVVVLTYWLSYEYVRDPRKRAGARKRPAGAAARRPPCAEPAGALPGAGPAHAPAGPGGRLQQSRGAPQRNDKTRATRRHRWPSGPPSPTPVTTPLTPPRAPHWARLHAGDAEPCPKDAKCWRPGRCSQR